MIPLKNASLRLPILLGIAHGLADAAAGFMLGVLPHHGSLDQALGLILLYNGLAFGGQPLVGMVTDRLHRPRLAVWVGLGALSLGLILISPLFLSYSSPYVLSGAIALAGVGSAAFHVGGGAIAYWVTPNSTKAAGLFTAPGVLGLAIGGALGFGNYHIASALAALLVAIAISITFFDLPSLPYPSLDVAQAKSNLEEQNLEERDTLIVLLIGAIALSSMVWTGLQLWLLGQTWVVMGMAIAAAVGKLSSGVLAEHWGRRRWAIGALLLATLLLMMGGAHPLTLWIGAALLQSTVPITLTATVSLMPHHPATAAGLALGAAVLLGGIPALAGLNLFSYPAAIALVLGLAAIALGRTLNPRVRFTQPRSTPMGDSP